MSNPAARDFLIRAFQGFYRPRSELPPWKWHEEMMTTLSTEESQDFAGPYDSSLAPQNRFFMEFAAGRFSENIEFLPGYENEIWRECVIKKSSQVGVTLSILLVIVWWIAEVGKNVIYAIDSATEARRISKARLQPLIRACKPAAAKISGGAESDDGMNMLTLYLLGMVVYLLGGHAEGAFQNKSASLGIIDEADFHPDPAPGQSNNVEELRTRMKAVSDAKIFVISKPKTEEHPTHKEHKRGTQHVCLVPCPHCDHYQELRLEGLRYEHCKDTAGEYDLDRVKRETYYECEFCHQPIYEHHKREMLLRHKWRQTNPRPAPGIISAHISDLYSQFSTATWGILASEYVQALKNVAAMTTFRRDRLGLAARLQQSKRTISDILRLRRMYHKGTIPVKPHLVVQANDVQGDVKPWVRGGFYITPERRVQLYIIDWGMTLAFDELLDVASDPIPVGMKFQQHRGAWTLKRAAAEPWSGETVIVEQGISDEGHITTEVRRFCLRSEGLYVPCKGRGGIQVRRTVNESVAEIDGEEITVYHFDDDDFKKQLYIGSIAGHEKILARKSGGIELVFPWETDAEFAAQLTSETLGTRRDPHGFSREVWTKDPSVPNDFGDCIKEMFVVWYWLGPRILAEYDLEHPREEGQQAA